MDFIEKSGKDESRYDPYFMYGSAPEGVGSINRWRNQIWNDFAARMQWVSTERFEDANHHPKAIVNGDATLRCLYLTVKPGDLLDFDASSSTDPDKDDLHYRWSVYAEPSTYKGRVNLAGVSASKCRVSIPQDASGNTIHLILEVTDEGIPSLTAYRRIVMTVK